MSGPDDVAPQPDPAGRAERIDSVIRDVLAGPRLRAGLSLGRLVRGWERVVGPDLARETAPWEFARGALVVAASSPAWAAQVRFLTADIRRRANQELGHDQVVSVRVIVRREAGS